MPIDVSELCGLLPIAGEDAPNVILMRDARVRKMVKEEVQKVMPKCALCRHYTPIEEKRLGLCEKT
ncbi:MAG: hypothetical protein ABIH23_19545, partial [bacterium]